VAFLPNGTVVVVLDGQESNADGSWQQVQADGQSGWVLTSFLDSGGG
jgi:hypothetical protein